MKVALDIETTKGINVNLTPTDLHDFYLLPVWANAEPVFPGDDNSPERYEIIFYVEKEDFKNYCYHHEIDFMLDNLKLVGGFIAGEKGNLKIIDDIIFEKFKWDDNVKSYQMAKISSTDNGGLYYNPNNKIYLLYW